MTVTGRAVLLALVGLLVAADLAVIAGALLAVEVLVAGAVAVAGWWAVHLLHRP